MSKYYDELLKLAEKDEKKVKRLLINNYITAITEMKKVLMDYTHNYAELSFAKQMELKRLENLTAQMNLSLEKLYDNNYNIITDHDKSTFDREYFGVFYEVENVANINLQFSLLNEDYIMQAIETPIEGLKLSERLYDKHLNDMKLRVKGAVTQGLINGSGYASIAKTISDIGWTNFNHALTIAITEAGRMKSVGRQKAQQEVVSKGVQLEKKWLSTLDKKTRTDHQQLDGQTVGIDEEFHIHGYTAQQPRLFGVAKEDIGCRCDTVTIVEGISPELRRDNENKQVVKYKNYEEWYDKSIKSVTEKEYNKLIDLSTSNNIKITGISDHIIDRAIERNVPGKNVRDALLNPLKVGKIKKKDSGNSQEFTGGKARVIINPDTGNIITVWKTSTKLRDKLKGGK